MNYNFGPHTTPALIRRLIGATGAITLLSSFTNGIIQYLFKTSGPQEWLSLSWWGMENSYLWQPLTHLFVQSGELSILFFFVLAFNLYILWVMGSDLVERVGSSSFLGFYILTGVGSGLITLLLMPLFGQYTMIAGPSSVIWALLLIWAFLNPERELLLFFLLPVKAIWLVLGLLGVVLLIALSHLDFITFFWTISGVFLGYLYALIAWGVHNPFPHFYRFELATLRLFNRLKPKKSTNPSKIFHLRKEENLGDDAFIDSMLEKISKKGKSSLTSSERKRMDAISKKKQGR